jgi:hypothetical protein
MKRTTTLLLALVVTLMTTSNASAFGCCRRHYCMPVGVVGGGNMMGLGGYMPANAFMLFPAGNSFSLNLSMTGSTNDAFLMMRALGLLAGGGGGPTDQQMAALLQEMKAMNQQMAALLQEIKKFKPAPIKDPPEVRQNQARSRELLAQIDAVQATFSTASSAPRVRLSEEEVRRELAKIDAQRTAPAKVPSASGVAANPK